MFPLSQAHTLDDENNLFAHYVTKWQDRKKRAKNRASDKPFYPLLGRFSFVAPYPVTYVYFRLPPEAVASLPGVRKALGVAAIVQEPPVPDLESELREFLESQSSLAVDDDKTIEEIFSES